MEEHTITREIVSHLHLKQNKKQTTRKNFL